VWTEKWNIVAGATTGKTESMLDITTDGATPTNTSKRHGDRH
jgi:hypothetical protein